MSIVYTGGTFDLFHVGHVQLLECCRKIAGSEGHVIVGLNTDEFVERFKGKRPIMNYWERSSVLDACQYVDEVVPNIGEELSTATIDTYGPVDFVVIGSDWAPPRDYYGQMGFTPGWLNERGIHLIYVDRNTGVSSTKVKGRIEAV